MDCENCKTPMSDGLVSWHFVCSRCGLEASSLEPAELADSDAIVDEADREVGLEGLRKAGFAETFQKLRAYRKPGRLLDVGSAHGWFLDIARDVGYTCTGIEPSVSVAKGGASRGHTIIPGYFPSALPAEATFDVVSFNDVFEHIPHAAATMRSAVGHLAPGGILSIAIPSSNGFFYRLSKLLIKVGVCGPFERMWQKNFSSPHLYYFNETILTSLAGREGLETVHRGNLPSVRLAGLWSRLAYDTSSSRVRNMAIFVTVVMAIPFLSMLPADIDLVMYKKQTRPETRLPPAAP